MVWKIELHDEVERWLLDLHLSDPRSARLVSRAINTLTTYGPMLRRPLVGHVKSAVYHNLKELRPPSAGRAEIRILFAFDPERSAILLIAGDKAGNWNGWYDTNIPIAGRRYAAHLARQDRKD